jgi:quinol monooxygenase YgiN
VPTVDKHKGGVVPVVRIGKTTGDPSDLRAAMTEFRRARVSSLHRLLAHVAARTDEGLIVINVWQSEEDLEAAWNRPEFQQALQEAAVSPN